MTAIGNEKSILQENVTNGSDDPNWTNKTNFKENGVIFENLKQSIIYIFTEKDPNEVSSLSLLWLFFSLSF